LDDRIRILFKRYQEGTATAEETKLVESWFESHYGQQGKKLSRNEELAVFADLDQRVAEISTTNLVVGRRDWRWLQAAALFFVLLASGLYLKLRPATKVIMPETYAEIRSVNGVKKEVILKDGTSVFLNSGSSVFVSSKYGESKREVKLTGEAFFKVKHNASKPFVIHSGKLQTTVLGTSFNIKAYPEDDRVKVTVASGKVKVEADQRSGKKDLYAKGLIHNQALVYNKLKDSHAIKIVNADSTSAWRTNHLIFEEASHQEIVNTLARWYNLDIKLSTAADAKKYTLSFYNERPDKVLNILSALTGTTYVMNGRKVTISPKTL
jgi:transmembrane sensor